MRIPYYEDTDSFGIAFGGPCPDAVTVCYDFIVDLDWEDRVRGVECIGARRHLAIADIIATPPSFKWVTLADGEPVPPRATGRDRYFIHRPAQDTVHIEFALGEPVSTEPVVDGVYAELNTDGAVAGLHVANASRNLDLDAILADGTPAIQWEPHPAPVTAGN